MPQISLKPNWEEFAQARVRSGRFASLDEVMEAGLKLLAEQDDRRAAFTRMLEQVEREANEKGWITAEELDAELAEIIARAEAEAS